MGSLIKHIAVKTIKIPFKVVFKHASAQRSETESLWVEITSHDGLTGFGEGCPRQYVTGESLPDARNFLQNHRDAIRREINDLPSLRTWLIEHQRDIDAHPAAWCAMELALLDLFAKTNGCSVEAALSLPEVDGSFRYTAVLGDSGPEQFKKQWTQYRHLGFSDFKIKLSGDLTRDQGKIALLRGDGDDSIRVRLDANNLWQDVDEAVAHIRALQYPIFAIEEPLAPGRYANLAELADRLNIKIILDESFVRFSQFGHIKERPDRWIINLRISKMGGLLRSLAIVDQARQLGISLIIGAQVGETSLLTRAALTVANAAQDMVIAQEGAFGTWLLTEDICTPPIMFQDTGVLNIVDLKLMPNQGFGIEITSDLPFLHE